MGDLDGVPVFCSWSGGKDSALALHEAAAAGALPRLLVSMMVEGGERSRSHGLAGSCCRRRPTRSGCDPLRRRQLGRLRGGDGRPARGCRRRVETPVGIFGDIDTESHREWVEGVCARAGTEAALPLWQRERRRVIGDLLEAGFEPVIVAVRDGVLPPELLGKVLDAAAVEEIERHGADAAGENGEFHTFVVDGPIFRRRLEVELGERSLRDGVWFTDAWATAAS